jgi:hypothetical protein
VAVDFLSIGDSIKISIEYYIGKFGKFYISFLAMCPEPLTNREVGLETRKRRQNK